MITLQDQLTALYNHVSRYGDIVSDSRCEIEGNHDRITTYAIEGKRITFSLHNGNVSGVIYR